MTEKSKTKYYLVDASKKPLGRFATKVAYLLRGKNSPAYRPNVLPNIIVIVINAKGTYLSGNKNSSKQYFKYSGYHGGIKTTTFSTLQKDNPVAIVRHAVRGMLPDNRMRDKLMKNLKIYPDSNHPYINEKNLIVEE